MATYLKPRVPCPDCGKPMLRTSQHCRLCAHRYIGIAQRHPRTDPVIRFWSYVDRSGGPSACWPWTRFRGNKGYGLFGIKGGKAKRAHRHAYELTHGPIPKGLYACHHCDNPPCCNPAHIFIGTQKDNMQDAIHKNRRADRWSNHHPEETHPSARLTVDQVHDIRSAHTSGTTQSQLARQYNIAVMTVHNLVNRKTWKQIK